MLLYYLLYIGLIERFNCMLCFFIEENSNNDEYWYIMLFVIVFVYCISVYLSIGFLFFEMLYGCKFWLLIVLLGFVLIIVELSDFSVWLDGLL